MRKVRAGILLHLFQCPIDKESLLGAEVQGNYEDGAGLEHEDKVGTSSDGTTLALSVAATEVKGEDE